MNLIIEVHLEYSGDAWQVYGQRFRQEWLWLQKLNGLQQIPHYGILHLQATPMPKDANTTSASITLMIVVTGHKNQPPHPSGADLPLTFAHLHTPLPDMPHMEQYSIPSLLILWLKYEHICCICAKLPTTTDLAHMVIYCAHWNDPNYNQNHYTDRQPLSASQS